MGTLGYPLITAATMSAVYLYLFAVEREKYLAIWAGAFALWTIRYAFGAFAETVVYADAAVVLPLLALARAGVILWGARELYGLGIPRWWLGIAGIDLAWLGWVVSTDPVLPFPDGLTHYVIFGLTTLAAGVLFSRAPLVEGPERFAAGAFVGGLGAINLLFPFLSSFPLAVVELLFGITAFIQIGIGISALLVYFRIARTERERLHMELEGRLTQVISGYLPICSHCKSVREGEEWSKIESFVSRRSDASFSHSICPDCYSKHWEPEYGPLS